MFLLFLLKLLILKSFKDSSIGEVDLFPAKSKQEYNLPCNEVCDSFHSMHEILLTVLPSPVP
jgi:hypothetical protein